MEVFSEALDRRRNGTLDVIPLPRLEERNKECDHLAGERSLYRWRPPYQIEIQLPAWYEIALECTVCRDGLRRFCPVGISRLPAFARGQGLKLISTSESLALIASIGGHLIEEDRGKCDKQPFLTHHEERLLVQYIQHTREYLGRRSGFGRAIGVCEAGRSDQSTKNVLPSDLGLDANDDGEVWGPSRLRDEGLHAAIAAGNLHPEPDQVFRYGLMEGAKHKPFYLRNDESIPIVQMLFFALADSDSKVTPDQLEYVAARVSESLRDHLDDSDEKFRKWINDPDSNLLHRISKRRDCLMERQHVKKVLLELGWHSLLTVGRCIDAQMRAFRDAIPNPLTDKENFLFAEVFLANPIYGDLPLLLLHDRRPFLKEAISNVWNHPDDPDAIGILYRMMDYYSVMIGNRRVADRIYKRQAKDLAPGEHVPRVVPLCTDVAAEHASVDQEIFVEVVTRLAIAREIVGKKINDGDCRAELITTDEDGITVGLYCVAFGVEEEFEVSVADFERTARRVKEERQ